MKINEYQKLCMRTANKLDGFKLIVNGAMGLCGEAGEVIDLIKNGCFRDTNYTKRTSKRNWAMLCGMPQSCAKA